MLDSDRLLSKAFSLGEKESSTEKGPGLFLEVSAGTALRKLRQKKSEVQTHRGGSSWWLHSSDTCQYIHYMFKNEDKPHLWWSTLIF